MSADPRDEWAQADRVDIRTAASLAGLQLGAGVSQAVERVVSRRLEAIAGDALEALLDDPTMQTLRDAADVAARAAIAQPPAPAPEPPQVYFADLEMFVSELLAPLYRRSLAGHHATWCREWWRHTEAIVRLEALWRSWEHLRLDPATGMSVWLRDHLDHHMRVLMDADGPFKGCTPDKHGERLAALPIAPAPPGFFVTP